LKTIALAVFPGVQALDIAGPADAFAEANRFVGAENGYALTLVSADCHPVRTSNGTLIAPDAGLDQGETRYDMVLAPGGPGLPTTAPDPRLVAWLARLAPLCRRHGSICTGAFLLGHAGLIDGKTVTTHWQDAAQLAALFPQARVEFDRIYVRDGALITSAGVAAGIDLALALVHEDHGAKVALAVAKRLVVVAQRQGGQSQFSPYLVPQTFTDTPIARVHAHVMAHIREPNRAETLAKVAAMTPRTFARMFVQESGITPAEFVERMRVDVARGLLEGGQIPLKSVAYESGFSSAEHMRVIFTKRFGIAPSQYRASFRVNGAAQG
jgi:transcriptional regulator GlxA family with amidase domain